MSINLWDLKNSSYTYYYDIASFISAIRNNKLKYDFSFKSKYISGEEISNPLEQNALIENYDIVFTDENHPVCLNLFESYIDRNFFENNKEIIIKEIQNQIIKDKTHSFIVINKYIFSDDFLKTLIDNYNGQHIIFKEIQLNDKQKKLLTEKHIYSDEIVDGIKKSISTNIAYDFYTFDDLNNISNITIYSDITNKEIDNLKDTKDLIINIKNVEDNEEDYYKKALKIINELKNNSHTIKIECNRRSLFNKYFTETNYGNINLIINNDFYDYPLEEFLNEEKILNSMVENINNSNLTPFEKYISVYNIVKNYKPYNEEKEDENPELSRDMRYILKNDYMVCVGFSKLFRELLDKVGIESAIYHTSVDISYDDGFTLENIPINNVAHSRVIVNLIDDKYKINGYYMSDPTWDNDKEIDKYSNMIMPFDYMQKSARLFKLEDFDYIFDVHNLEEFNYKIKLLFEKKISQKTKKHENYYSEDYNDILIETLYEIISIITKTIKQIDYTKYKEINEIWDKILYNVNDIDTIKNNYIHFISYIGMYIVKKVNKEIDKKTIIKAITNTKIKENKLMPEDIDNYTELLSKNFELQDLFDRPYNFPSNYLSENDDGVKNEKKIL